MAADGRIARSELLSLHGLVHLGFGSLEELTREELVNSAEAPIDVGTACRELVGVYPDAGPTVLAALVAIAVSDGELDPREIALLAGIGEALRVPPPVVNEIVRTAAARLDVDGGGARGLDVEHIQSAERQPHRETIQDENEAVKRPTAAPPGAVESTARPYGSTRPAADVAPLANAYALLGLEPGASPAAVEAAYRAVIERYQPSKVIDLGVEFAVLAVRRLAAATAAFTTLVAASEGA